MPSPRALVSALLFSTSFGLPSVLSASAHAAGPEGFAVNRFEPADRGSTWFVLDSLDFQGHPRPAAGLTLDYQHRPLAIYDDTGKDARTALVEHVVTTHLGFDVTLWNRLRLGLNLPLVLYTTGQQGSLRGITYDPPKSSTTVGDLRLGADVRFLGEHKSPLTMAVGARLWAPTGSTRSYTGDGAVRVGPRVSAAGMVSAGTAGAFVYGATLGVTFRNPKASTFADVPIDHDFVYGVSAGMSLVNGKVVVGPEFYGSTGLGSKIFKTQTSPTEILLGGHFVLPANLRAGVGIGTGLVGGLGAPGVRALGSIEWVMGIASEKDEDDDGIPDVDDACRTKKGPASSDPTKNGCPDEAQDTDGDGIPDAEDACSDVYGKRTNDKRTNGCDDRDKDGIMDPIDACPFEPGPARPDPAKNGCPDKIIPVHDRDKDGVPDEVDACPDTFGNKSDVAELNGCPDPDPDKDGIPTDVDACPDVPGKADPDPTKNGCPIAFLQGNSIRIKEQVKFTTATSADIVASDEVLQGIADVMKAHPEITKIRVEAHTDNRGGAANNKKLADKRATAVVEWLAAHGVARGRLNPVGVGQDRPIDANDTEQGRTANRRIEVHIESQE